MDHVWRQIIVPGDGSCFFHSLNVIFADKKDRRSMVSQAFLFPETEMEKAIVSQTIDCWTQMREVIPQEVAHVSFHGDGTVDREKTSWNMNQNDLYWGDEFALCMVEERENINIGLVERLVPFTVIARPRLDITKIKKYCCVLKLSNHHYSPTVIDDEGLFLSDECPEILLPCFT